MAKTIQQSVTFKAKASKLYAMYADSKMHSAATGQKASVGTAGGRISAYGGMISGTMLHTVKNKSIVQTWRAKNWKKSDPDSILILNFEDTKTGGRVSMVQANLSDAAAKSVTAGWKSFYWDPWRKYLADAAKPAKKPAKKAAARKKPAAKKKAPARKEAPARRTAARRR